MIEALKTYGHTAYSSIVIPAQSKVAQLINKIPNAFGAVQAVWVKSKETGSAFKASVIKIYQNPAVIKDQAKVYTNTKYQQTATTVSNFISQHQNELIVTGCSITTAYLSPGLFAVGFTVGIVGRIKGTELVEKWVRENFHHAAYATAKKVGPNERFVGKLDTIFATMATLNAIALKTLYYTKLASVSSFSAVGGMVVGDIVGRFFLAQEPINDNIGCQYVK